MRGLLLLVALSLLACMCSAQWCLNESGAPVDWWIIVKVPKETSSADPGVSSGTAYLYADAKSYLNPSQFWTNSSHQITDTDSAAGATIGQIYANSGNANYGYVMYNDETPSGTTSESYGHTKGHLAWSATSAFWLIHSVPKYADSPDNVNEYVYPSTGKLYGQSMLCMSLPLTSVNNAFEQFQYTNPQVYGSQWVAALASQLPAGDAFLNSGTVITTPSSNQVTITTAGGKQFTHFAKTVSWGKSIFGDLLGVFYNSAFVVETWQRPYEDPLLPPDVSQAVYSILDLQAPAYANWDGVTWKESQDHAKWGVNLPLGSGTPVFCVGDINKQKSQWARSGGMACVEDEIINAAFSAFIVDTDQNSTKIALW